MRIRSQVKSVGANFLSSTGILDFFWNREPSWRILMYHRVLNPEDLTYPIQAGMYVRPQTFEMHCKFLKKHATVIPVDELIQKVIDKEPIPKRTVAITFDDGWKDNLENAFPILKTLNLPATVFLPTDFIDTENLFWTDQVAHALVRSPENFENYSATESPSEKLEKILNALFALPLEKRKAQLEKFTKDLPSNDQREFLTWDEVSRLDLFGIKVGSHSKSHSLFKELSKEMRLTELANSREMLQTRSSFTSRVFVFPGGSYTEDMGSEIATSGYMAALKTGRAYSPNSLVFPRVGIHEDISYSESLFKYRLLF